MRVIKIFLASSLEELRDDRRKFSEFIGVLNDYLIEYDIYVKLFMCEYESMVLDRNGRQARYNEEIENSELAVFLFSKKVGQYTKEEFDVANKRFKEKGKPEILVCFRENHTETTHEVDTFQAGLKEIEHITYADFEIVQQRVWIWIQEKLEQYNSQDFAQAKPTTGRNNINFLFVCSSDDLQEDSSIIKGFFRELNDKYIKRETCNFYFKLVRPEDAKIAIRLFNYRNIDQSNFMDMDSELFIVVFSKKVESDTIEKLEEALKHFDEYHKPGILTLFRTDGSEFTVAVKKVIDYLQQLKHFVDFYSNISELKNKLIMQILDQDLDCPLKLHDGQVYAAGEKVLSFDDLSDLVKNKDWQAIIKESDEAEQKYKKAIEKYLQEDNKDNDRAVNEAREERDRCRQEKELINTKIIELAKRYTQNASKGYYTPRRQEAKILMAQGDSRAAYEIYDVDKICADLEMLKGKKQLIENFDGIKDDEQLRKESFAAIKMEAEQYVGELIDKADIVMTFQDITFRDRFYEAQKLYEIAIREEENLDLDRIAIKSYMKELLLWTDSRIKASKYWQEENLMPWPEIERSEQVAHQYLQYERQKKSPRDRKGEILAAQLLQKGTPKSKEEAETVLWDLLSTSSDDSERAKIYHYMANGLESETYPYINAERQKEIIKLRYKAFHITQALEKEEPEIYEKQLLEYCTDLKCSLDVCDDEESKREAKNIEYEWLMINFRLAKKNPAEFDNDPEFNLGELVHSILPHCDNSDVLDEAEELFRICLDIDRKEADNAYGLDKFDYGHDCYYFAEFLDYYRNTPESHIEAESLYEEVLEIEKELLQDDGEPLLGELLANDYRIMSKTCEDFHDAEAQRQAEILYRVTLRIWRGLAKASSKYLDEVACSCYNLADFLEKRCDMGSQQEAERLRKEAQEINRELNKM